MKRKNAIQILSLIALILSACGASGNNGQTEPTSGPDLALTITAQAELLQALTQAAVPPTTTPEPTVTSTPVSTATPSKVIATVSANTNCRSGPGADYEIIGALTVGQKAEVLGKSTSTGYWIIDNPLRAGTCWLWGEHASVTGDTSNLQEYSAPPTVTPIASGAPVIDGVQVRFDTSSGGMIAVMDVYYHDSEGDANFVDWQIISASADVKATIKDKAIAMSANQRKGSTTTAQWSCGTKVYDITFAVIIRDQAGYSSNPARVVVHCNQ